MAALLLAGLALVAWRFGQTGYLPQPFYYRVGESLMDLYTPAFWANHTDAYQRWHSIYPPFSFIFLKFTSLGGCYAVDDLAGRECDYLARGVLLAVFLTNMVLVYATYRTSDARTAIPRTIAMTLGLPMLYTLERGNLLIPCFTGFVLGYGNLLRPRWLRWLALAVSMNFKPYLGLVMMPLVIKRYWAWIAGCAAFTGAIYLATLLAYGSGSPVDIVSNEGTYASAASKSYFSDLYYATGYWPLIRMLHAYPAGLRLGSAAASQSWSLVLTIVLRATQAAALACVTLALFRPRRVNVRRLGALVAVGSITAYTTGSAGYAQLFLFFLVFFEPWRGPVRIAVITATYLLCLPFDQAIVPVVNETTHSYLSGRDVVTSFGISLGQLLRPALLLLIQCGLLVLNFADIFGREAEPDTFDTSAGSAEAPAFTIA